MYRCDVNIRIERCSSPGCDLTVYTSEHKPADRQSCAENATLTHQGFTLLHILLSKQKLSIEVGQVDCVQVQKCDTTKASQDDVLHYSNTVSDAEASVLDRWLLTAFGRAVKADVRSSHPIPPAPTSKTLTSGKRAANSKPRMAVAWRVRPDI